MKKLKIALWLVAMAGMFAVSMIPSVKFTNNADKAAHFAVYALLMVLPVLTFERRRHVVLAGFLLLAMSGVIEIIQLTTKGREGSFADFGANALGVLAGAAIAYLIKSGLRSR